MKVIKGEWMVRLGRNDGDGGERIEVEGGKIGWRMSV